MALKDYLINTSMYPIKSPYEMTPVGICIHNTDGSRPAKDEIDDMGTNSKQVSFHICIDDKEALLAIPMNRNAWHAGDGSEGDGNRHYISIEICYSHSQETWDLFDLAEERAIKETALLLKKYNWDISHLKKHKDFSSTDCPKRTCDKGWDRYVNAVKKELNNLGATSVPKNLPKFSIKKIDDSSHNSLKDFSDLRGITLYCNPSFFTFDKNGNGEKYDNLSGDYGNDRDIYDVNAYTKNSSQLIDENNLAGENGYHILIDGADIIETVPTTKICNHLKDNGEETYINKNLYNNKANDCSISVVMLMPKNTDYKITENLTAKYIATFLLSNQLSMDYFMRAFDLNKSATPLHLLDKNKWEKFVSKVKAYYDAIMEGKYTDNDLKELDNKEATTKDKEIRKFYFTHINDYNDYAKNFEPDDRGIDIIINSDNPDNMGSLPDEISSFQSKNNIDFAYTVSEKAGGNKCDCDSPYDSLTVKATPTSLDVEPIYPDTIVPPGGTITLVGSLNKTNSDVTSNVQLTLDEFQKRQQTFNAKDYKDAKKESNKGKPVNNNDPFPVDTKIEELESHTPKIKIDEVNYRMLECNHTGSQLAADVSKDLGMIQDQLLTIAKRTERRVVKLENIMATVMRNLFRISSRMQVNCVYYGGQDVYGMKY